jgi:hypothetical protein
MILTNLTQWLLGPNRRASKRPEWFYAIKFS